MSLSTRPNIAFETTQESTWYREPMVWMIISIPLSAVVVGMLMLTMAIRSYDGLVADDYYKQGKEINRVLERSRFAENHNMSATVDWRSDGQIEVSFDPGTSAETSEILSFHLLHRTQAGLDRSSVLDRYADGRYRGVLDKPERGIWVAQLDTKHWRLYRETSFPSDQSLVLGTNHE